MDKDQFEKKMGRASRSSPLAVEKWREFGRAEVGMMQPRAVTDIANKTPHELWFAADEAKKIENLPVLGLIALAAYGKQQELRMSVALARTDSDPLYAEGRSASLQSDSEDYGHVLDYIYSPYRTVFP